MNTLFLDCETYSEVELKTRGTYVYAESCEVMLLSYAWNDEPVECADLTAGQPLPDFSGAERVVAHNAMFDRLAAKKILDIPIELWFCSMVQALSHGLPGSLDELCEIYRISDDKAKIKDGRRLIQLFCKPRKTKNGLVRNTRETHPEEWARFIEYAKNDIEAMREIHKKLPRWNYPRQPELALWHLDQVINDRGVMIDREMGEAAIRAIKRAQASLAEQTADMTEGGLESTTQVAAMIQFIFEEYGVHFNDLTKAQVSKAIDDPDIPEPVKDLLRVRQQASSSSTAKYKALLNRANDDDRFRGGLQFAGASRTLRCSGRGFQPQNLPSRGLLPDNLIEHGIELMKCDAEDLVFPNVMHLASSAIRRVLIAAPGKKFCISDLANIEGRKVAWYAGEEWKLQAFRDFDGGTGQDLYNMAYSKAFQVPVESVNKDERSIGKVMELACFHPNTQVLTDNGIKRITEVLTTDKLWDGVEWVKHGGVIEKAARPVVHVAGIGVTEDHLILTPKTWLRAKLLVSSESTLSQALVAGSKGLKSSDTITRLRVISQISYNCAVIAAKNGLHTGITYAQGVLRSVENARLNHKENGGNLSMGMRISYPTKNNEYGCLRGFAQLSRGAIRLMKNNTTRTEAGALKSASNGAMMLANFYAMLSRAPDGVIRLTKWIGSTIIVATNRVISDSLLKRLITKTGELSQHFRPGLTSLSELYDIADAGPLNRFTVISNRGPLIVHNCGYSGGVGAFVTMSGGYGFNLEELADKISDTLPVDTVRESAEFLEWWKTQKKGQYGLTDKAFITVDVLKRLWRQSNARIVGLWRDIKFAAENTIITREPHDLGLLRFDMKGRWLRIRLASGRFLCYPFAEYDVDNGISYYGVDQYTRKWQRIRTYNGKLFENICQSSARCVLYDSMPIAEAAGFPIVLHVHDELVTETEQDKHVEELSAIMAAGHPWTEGLPLAAAGFESLRYKK